MTEDYKKKYAKNYRGEDVSNIHRKLSDPSYGKNNEYDTNGEPKVDWDRYIIKDALQGFLKREDGTYYQEIELPTGTHILRYGTEAGSHTAPAGTPYECLALPYVKETLEYNEYIVIADGVKVLCQVKEGIVAPSLDSPGMVTQYKHSKSIERLCNDKVLHRVDLWGDD